jgi:hypothetical protein
MTSSFTISPRAAVVGATVALATGALLAGSVLMDNASEAATSKTKVPQSRQMEAKTGIRVLSAHAVGDGGIVDVRYQVLDPLKASIVEGDPTKTPALKDVRNGAVLTDTAAMRHGHAQRPAGTYFLLYFNKGGVVKSGDFINVSIAGLTLNNVPVT